jgi:6-methylsalicylate decarboxylase
MSRTVDLHQHIIPDFYWEASNEDGNAAGGITPPRWSLDAAIAYLDEARIDVAVPSISTPGVHFDDDAAARNLARRVNEYLADIKRDRPDRFGAFAALPLPEVEGSLDQIAYAFDMLELDGLSMLTNAGGSYLADSRFDPIFAELHGRAAVVFVHPTTSTFARTPDVKYLFATAQAPSKTTGTPAISWNGGRDASERSRVRAGYTPAVSR